jgi:hypothetical protein
VQHGSGQAQESYGEVIIRRMEKNGAEMSCLDEEQLFRVICSYDPLLGKSLKIGQMIYLKILILN